MYPSLEFWTWGAQKLLFLAVSSLCTVLWGVAQKGQWVSHNALMARLHYPPAAGSVDTTEKCETIRKLLISVIGHGSLCNSYLSQLLLRYACPWTASQAASLQGSPERPFSPPRVKSFSPLLPPTAGGQWHMKCMLNIIRVYNANNLSRQHLTQA